MNHFINKTLTIAGITFLTIIIFQCIISFKIFNKYTTGHDNLDQTTNINAELVFLGSSRCWAHFDPLFFQRTFNLKSANIGVDGHSQLSMAYVRLQDYLMYNTPPKFVILSFDPFVSAGSFSQKAINIIHKDCFARYAFRPLNKDWGIINYFGFNKLERYVPLYSIFKYKQLTNCLFTPDKSAYEKYGYSRHDKNWDTTKVPLNDINKKHFKIDTQKDLVKNYLEKLNHLCAASGVKLICIQTPVYKTIYDKKAFEIPGYICSQLDIPFIDANRKHIRDDISNFYNTNHINTIGIQQMNKFLSTNPILLSTFNIHETAE